VAVDDIVRPTRYRRTATRESSVKNRRASARHSATEYRVWLGLWAGPDQFEAQAARVENISLGGARIVIASPPAKAQRVWLRVGTSTCTDCVQATVLEIEALPAGDFAARLAFDAPCPPRLLQTVAQTVVPTPHFRLRPRVQDQPGEMESGRQLTHSRRSSIIPHLFSKSRTSV